MKKRDIQRDKDLEVISIEHIDKDISNIEVVGDLSEPKGKKIFAGIITAIVAIILAGVMVVSAYVVVNMKIVQGNVDGAVTEIAGYSIVDKDYDPINFIKSGATIYYDGNKDGFVNLASSYKVGKIDRIADNRIYLESGDYLRDDTVLKQQVNYVLYE